MSDPIDWPIDGVCFRVCRLQPDAGTVQDGGMITRTRRQRWVGRFETGTIARAALYAWENWAARLDGGLMTFLATDTSRGLPQAYWAAGAVPDVGGQPWDGAAAVTAVDPGGAVTVTGLPPAYQVTRADRVGLTQTIAGVVRRGYFEAVADATADGSGEAQITVRPFPAPLFSAGAVGQLVRPTLAMQLISHEADHGLRPSFAFSGRQVL